MATVADAIADALTRLGVIRPGDTARASDSAYAFSQLNILTDTWGTQRLTIPYTKRTTATLTANQTSFTVGTSGNINIVRPVFISSVGFIDTSQDPDLEIPLRMLSDGEYASIALKAQTSTLPSVAYYQPTYASSQGTLYPWPIPTSTTLQWAIYHPVAVPSFSAVSATLTIPPGYHELIVSSLAAKLGLVYGVPPEIRRECERAAAMAMQAVKAANFPMEDMANSASGVFGNRRRGNVLGFLTGP